VSVLAETTMVTIARLRGDQAPNCGGAPLNFAVRSHDRAPGCYNPPQRSHFRSETSAANKNK